MIHVCLCFTDRTGRYSKFVGTTMLSIFENTNTLPPSICVHILHDSTLTDDNRDKFSYLAGRYGQPVKFYNVEKICADNFSKMTKDNPKLLRDNRFTIGMMFRLFIPQILSEDTDKVIYLDADIIVNMDIKELWEVNLGDKYLAAIPSNSLALKKNTHISKYLCVAGLVKPDDYFNSGVLLLNLKKLRSETQRIMDGINFIGSDPRYTHFDQDVLNYCFTKGLLKLSTRFNNSVSLARLKKETKIVPAIYHYLGSGLRSFGLNINDPYNRLWMSCFIKTPWFNANTIGKIFSDFVQIISESENQRLRISAIMPGKSRVFFVEPSKVEKIKKIFSINTDKAIIPAEGEGSLQKLLDAMKAAKGKSVFFIMTEKFSDKKFPFEQLTAAGFIGGKDFVKGWNLLSENNGEPFNTYSLVQSM